MSDRSPPQRTALVLSPFATWPADVGHRRRTAQTTAMLRDAGYRVVFLLYAFEGGWYWRMQRRDFDEMRRQWDEVIVVQAEHSVGLPPRDGRLHTLDEWWSAELETVLRNLFRHRHFDVFVAHNVWLSKALSLAPRSTITVLETHDLFWKRRALLDSLGIGHDFYEPEQASEIYGIDRAAIAVTIQERDARDLLPLVKSRVVTVPFYDASGEAEAPALRHPGYRHPEKVTFGFLGSAHTYNVTGMQAVLNGLEERVARSFAPVDVVLGGTASDVLKTRLPARRLGRVPSETEFYAECDIALAPTFQGTGFKIKVADMLALGLPSLVARHSAIGTTLDGEAVVDTPEEMADAMVRIALTRPPLIGLRGLAQRARDDLRRRAETGAANFFRLLNTHKPCLIVDLSAFGPERGILPLVSYLSLVRHLPAHALTHLVLRPDMLERVEGVLPVGVRPLLREEVQGFTAAMPRRVVVDVAGDGSPWFTPAASDLVRRDRRWGWLTGEAVDAMPDASSLPLFYSDLSWDPAVAAIRKAWRATATAQRMPEGTERIVFLDWAGGAPSASARLRHALWLVDVRDTASVEAAIMSLVDAPEASLDIVWAAQGRDTLRRLVMEAAVLARHRVSGLLDGCFHGAAQAHALFGNVDIRLRDGVRAVLARVPASA